MKTAYIKIDIDPDIKTSAEANIHKKTGLKLTQWLRAKVYEAASEQEDKSTDPGKAS